MEFFIFTSASELDGTFLPENLSGDSICTANFAASQLTSAKLSPLTDCSNFS